jgi:hypothetical protein
MVLPPACRRVEAVGDPELLAILRAAGFDVAEGAEPPAEVRLIDCEGDGWRAEVRDALEDGFPRDLTVVTVGGGRPGAPPKIARALRALQLLASPIAAVTAARNARRAERMLASAGLEVSSLSTGDRSRVYGIGRGSWRRVRRLPVGAIVSASLNGRPQSVAQAAFEAASDALGEPLSWQSAMVLESGKLLIDVTDANGRGYVLWVAGYPSRAFLEKSIKGVGAIGAEDPPPPIRERIAWPLTTRELGLARYSLEPKLGGVHPRNMTPALWADCMEFLIALHTLSRGSYIGAGEVSAHEPFASDIAVLERHVRERDRAALRAIATELAQRLEGVPLGWSHGDFWNQNLLVHNGRLTGVLDWDLSDPRSLPLLDLMDLILVGGRRGSELGPGPRFTRMLWPLVQEGGDERIDEYCAGTGTPCDQRTLEALAASYWIVRLARRLRPYFGDTPPPTQWLAENLHDPIELLGHSSFITAGEDRRAGAPLPATGRTAPTGGRAH